MSLPLNQAQIEEHNTLYKKAWRLVDGEFHLDGKPLSQPNWFARRRLKKAKGLFLQTFAINSTGWNAMFAIGKIEQRLGEVKTALEWFLRAREFAPTNTSLAKEASITASSLGDFDMAARIADEALETNTGDPALYVNSGLAHILAGNCESALRRFQEASALEPERVMNAQLVSYTSQVIAKELPAPKVEADIIRGLPAA
jgi:tetratricopeptide (TPR) repeat protein